MNTQKQTWSDFAHNFALFLTCLVFIVLTATIFYWIASFSLTIDFTSYYLTIKAVWQGKDPYHGLTADFISLNPMLSRNLNTPLTLLLGLPLQWLPYPIAYLVFAVISFILGIMAANLSTRYFLSGSVDPRTRLLAILIYCASFPVLLSLVTGQFGAILFFLIMIGYYGYRRDRSLLTIGAWSMAMSMKFFAGLLIIFCLQQKRYRLTIAIIISAIILSILPILVFGSSLYSKYLKLMLSINWYDGSWNASLVGFLSRTVGCFTPVQNTQALVKIIWLLLGIPGIFWYGKSQLLKDKQTVSFAMCLVLMIIFSPLGWIYYFSILMPALLLCYQFALDKPSKEVIWLGCIILVTFPIGHLRALTMPGCFYRLSLYSLQFYGVFLLIVQLIWGKRISKNVAGTIRHLLYWPIYLMLFFGLLFLFSITQARIS